MNAIELNHVEWIGEENNHVDISLYNFCPYLLISP